MPRIRILAIFQSLLALLAWGYAANWSEILSVYGVDIGYVMMADASELREYYPQYYWLIWSVSRFVRFGLPVGIVALTVLVPHWRRACVSWLNGIWNKDKGFVLAIVAPLTVTFGISLLAYYLLTPSNPAPFKYQQLLAKTFLALNTVNTVLVAFYGRVSVSERLREFLFKPELPYTLALTRILFFSYTCYLYIFHFNGSNLGKLEKVHLPFVGWLIDLIPVTPDLYAVFLVAGAVFSFLVAIGYRTRIFLALNAVTIFYVVAVPNFFGKLAHEHMVIWMSWILAFSPCADVLSLDAKRNKQASVLAKPAYNYHLKIIWLHFGLVYFFAGFFKFWICGFDWALTDSMINQVRIEWFEHFDKVSEWRVDRWPWFLKVSGVVVVFFELAYIVMLFGKRLKWVSIIGALVMHNLIGKMMYIAFRTMLQAFYIVFIPWNSILQKLGWVKHPEKTISRDPNWTSGMVLGPLLILCLNTLFGAFNINSYPFSVYPVYAEIVPDNVRYLEYRVLDKDFQDIDVWKEGAKHSFKWERYSRTEYHIIRMWEGGRPLDSAGVETLWRRWQLDVPTLAELDSVDVYVVERPLEPEKADIRISEKYLMRITEGFDPDL